MGPPLPRPRVGGLPAAVVAAALGVLVVLPLTRLVWAVLGDGRSSVTRVVTAPGFGLAAAHSLELATIVALLAVPLGAAMALALRRPGLPCHGLLRLLAVLPLLVPQFVLGYSWTQAYGRGGFTDDLAGVHWDGLAGPYGLIAVLVIDAAPLSYLLTTVGLATRARPELELAARCAGAGRWAVLRTIVLPLLRPVLVAGFLLTFVTTLESFAAPQVLGAPAGYATLTTRLYADLAYGSDPASFLDAMTLALGLVVLAAVLLLPADVLVMPRLRSRRGAHAGPAAQPSGRGAGDVLAAALLALYALAAVILPTIALVAASITRAVGLPPRPGNWTLDNFRAALDRPTRAALLHSLELALSAAALLTVLAALVCVLERRRRGRVLATLTTLTFALPGSALAVGLLIAYDRRLGGTLALILLAYLAKFWALAHRTVSGAADRVPAAEGQAARVSGASSFAAARTVWLPALGPALLGAAVLVFAASLHEVTMSSLLYSSRSETFAVAVLNSQELGTVSTTAALSVTLTAMTLVAAVPAVLLVRFGLREPARHPARRAAPRPAGEVAGVG